MKKYFAAIALVTAMLSSSAFAHAVHVEEPEVNAGKFDIHDIAAFSMDDDDGFDNELELSYGFNDWFLVQLSHLSGEEEGDSYDWYAGGEAAVQFELTDEGKYRPVTGVQISYNWHAQSEHADNLEVKGLLRKNIGPVNNLLNLAFSHDIGPDSEGGIDFDIAARSTYEFNHSLGLGLEYFGEFGQIDDMADFDEQGHLLGPIVTFEPFEGVHMHSSLAYLFGISDDAPDGTLKLEVGFQF